MNALPYGIGSELWPGLGKVIEEAGEVAQAAGKIIASDGAMTYWDGSDLRERIQEEVGDLLAAVGFLIEANSLDEAAIRTRRVHKLGLFRQWHGATRRAAARAAVPQG